MQKATIVDASVGLADQRCMVVGQGIGADLHATDNYGLQPVSALSSKPQTLHPTPCTLGSHTKPQTPSRTPKLDSRNPEPDTLNPKFCMLNSTPGTPNPNSQTLHPQPQILNSKPETVYLNPSCPHCSVKALGEEAGSGGGKL